MKTMATILLMALSPSIADVGVTIRAWPTSVSLDQEATFSADDENGLVFEDYTDTQGRPLEGTYAYLLRLERKELPPHGTLWWLTLEDPAEDPLAEPHVGRELGVYDGLRTDSDGSVTIYVQHDDPGTERRPNWLTAPRGLFGLSLRLDAGKRDLRSASWTPPDSEVAP